MAARSAVVEPPAEPLVLTDFEKPSVPSPAHRSTNGYDGNTALTLYMREVGQVRLLTAAEEQVDAATGHLRFDIALLAERLSEATDWLQGESRTRRLPVGYFGASTGAGAALVAAAKRKRVRTPETPAQSKPAPKARQSTVGPDSGLEEALRIWRLAEARRRGVPGFRIFSDQALRGIAKNRPGTARELLAIPGIGMTIVERYGAQIYRILHEGRR